MKSHKNGQIEAIRIIAAIAIVSGHMGLFGMDVDRPFRDSWFFVELFFMLTGGLTLQHYSRSTDKEDVFQSALHYTFAKFSAFFWYTIPAILVQYMIYIPYLNGMDKENIIQFWEGLPIEILYLSSLDVNGAKLFTMWFLSAMFLVFPWFCVLAQMKRKALFDMIAIGVTAFFYLHQYDYGEQIFPNQLFRAFAGMMLGGVAYHIAGYVRELIKERTIILKFMFGLGVLIPLIIGGYNIRALRVCLLCFAMCVVAVFSENKTKERRQSICRALGGLAFPMILWHWVIGTVILLYLQNLSMGAKIGLFWGGTILLSAVHTGMISIIKRKNRAVGVNG